jgi:hypothetical protein
MYGHLCFECRHLSVHAVIAVATAVVTDRCRMACSLQPLDAHEHAVHRPALEVASPLHRAVVLAERGAQLHTRPQALPQLRADTLEL